MSNMWKLLWLTEEDPSTRRVFLWRLVVSAFMTLLAIFVIFSFGGIWGLDGFALASDVDTKIVAALQPVNDKLYTIEQAQKAQNGYLKHLVKSDLERLIDREILARCNAATSVEKQRIKDHINAYQKDYKEVFGHEYDEPDCADV
ncbi:hypothetical protein LCGC14_2893170 [marine sediment metagenome]|uniref:Uncharacterized protein n=1 Tax=marine sediment metagenome TaxID=412755 RepID=A0A0F8XWZ9_9ZZZZ